MQKNPKRKQNYFYSQVSYTYAIPTVHTHPPLPPSNSPCASCPISLPTLYLPFEKVVIANPLSSISEACMHLSVVTSTGP